MKTPKRLRHYFRTKVGAEIFAEDMRDRGAKDVVIVPKNFQTQLQLIGTMEVM